MKTKNKKVKNENTIHIKINYEEALQSKKAILLSEMNLLRVIKIVKKYKLLRLNEFKLKIKLYRKIREINNSIKKLQNTLPKTDMPDILKEEKPLKRINNQKRVIKERKYDDKIESQLQDIQSKLNSLN